MPKSRGIGKGNHPCAEHLKVLNSKRQQVINEINAYMLKTYGVSTPTARELAFELVKYYKNDK